MNEQMLMKALSDVGDDLIAMAEEKHFVNPWRKWAQTAAALAVVACLGVFALPYFPMGCGSSMETTAQGTTEEAPMELYDEAVEECEEAVAEETAAQTVEESWILGTDEGTEDLLLSEEKMQNRIRISVDDVQRALEEEDFQWLAEAFVLPAEDGCNDPMDITVQEAKLEEDMLYLQIMLPEQGNVIKEYILQYDQEFWRYISVSEVISDGAHP